MPSPSRPLLAGTIGDPAGVGPLVWAAAARGRLPADVVLLGDARALERWLPAPLPAYTAPAGAGA